MGKFLTLHILAFLLLVRLTSSTYDVNESDGFVEVCAELTMQSNPGLSVLLNTNDGKKVLLLFRTNTNILLSMYNCTRLSVRMKLTNFVNSKHFERCVYSYCLIFEFPHFILPVIVLRKPKQYRYVAYCNCSCICYIYQVALPNRQRRNL